MDFLSLYLKLFYRAQLKLTWQSLKNEFWKNIVNELSLNLKLNQEQSYLQEKTSYSPTNVEV